MPSKSLAQNRYVHAAAARGEQWAQRWVREQHGKKVPRIEHVRKKKRRRRRLGEILGAK